MQWLRRYFLVLILAITFCILQYELWFSSGGILQHHHLKQRLQQEKILLEKQGVENQHLFAAVMKIKHNPELIEAHARSDLGMVKRGEEYVEVVEQSVT